MGEAGDGGSDLCVSDQRPGASLVGAPQTQRYSIRLGEQRNSTDPLVLPHQRQKAQALGW